MPSGVYKRSSELILAQKRRAIKTGHLNRGRKRPEMTGRNHFAWKGVNVKYGGLHDWVRRRLGKPEVCSFEDITCKGQIQWANFDGKYSRDLNSWIPLCISHHRRFDNANKKL